MIISIMHITMYDYINYAYNYIYIYTNAYVYNPFLLILNVPPYY